MSSEVVLKVENISKRYEIYQVPHHRLLQTLFRGRKQFYKEFWALKDVSFEVKKGECLGIIGRNGSGKSTLLQIIAGTLAPTAGSIKARGRISALLELGSGFSPEFTGLENVYMNGAIMGFSKAEMDQKFDEIAAFADIGEFIEQPVKIYSSGMLVRLAFSAAIMVDPDILIIDEALSVGDALFQRKCFSKINSFIEDGKTVLFVSHNLDTVAQLCSRAGLMDAGEIILDAKPKLVRNYYFKLLYSPAEEYQKAREKIESINRDDEHKIHLEKEQLKHDESADVLDSVTMEITEKSNGEKDFYLPDLVSKSVVQTKKHDVDIYDIYLKNINSETVNYIVTDDQYVYSYKVKFNIAASKVTFRIIFKTIKGLIISLAEAPGKYPFNFIEQVEAGGEFLVEWFFKCSLLTGTYYSDIAVWGSVNHEERSFLNKVADVLVFEVQDVPDNKYKGLVHLEQHAKIKKISC